MYKRQVLFHQGRNGVASAQYGDIMQPHTLLGRIVVHKAHNHMVVERAGELQHQRRACVARADNQRTDPSLGAFTQPAAEMCIRDSRQDPADIGGQAA